MPLTHSARATDGFDPLQAGQILLALQQASARVLEDGPDAARFGTRGELACFRGPYLVDRLVAAM